MRRPPTGFCAGCRAWAGLDRYFGRQRRRRHRHLQPGRSEVWLSTDLGDGDPHRLAGVVQEMCARLGAATGRGLLDLIRERFGLGWALFAVGMILSQTAA